MGEVLGGEGGVLPTPLCQILHSESLKQNLRLAVHILSTAPSICDAVAALPGSHNIPKRVMAPRERERVAALILKNAIHSC